jgi:predicted nucleic acid-binding protein
VVASVADSELFLSAMTIREIAQGIERERRIDQARAERREQALSRLRSDFAGRIIPVDDEIAAEWGRSVGEKDKHRDDMAYAATARTRGLVLVTRNVKDFAGREVRVLDPFKKSPKIVVA